MYIIYWKKKKYFDLRCNYVVVPGEALKRLYGRFQLINEQKKTIQGIYSLSLQLKENTNMFRAGITSSTQKDTAPIV